DNPAWLNCVTPILNTWPRCTGGGGYSFAADFSTIGVQLDRRDEMACLVNGLNFQMRYMENEVFSVKHNLTSMVQV
ncbi:unnamed protein product, partial [Discosporangium mesarthrocarpum]